MERPSGFRTSHTGLLTPYRYGDRKWEDYLLDTQTHIYDAAQAQVTAIEGIGRQAAEQASEQAQLLQDFIARAGGAWERVSTQLDTLTDQLASGFSSLSDQTKYNGELLEKIVGQLGLIAKSINNPLATQANELVRSGEHLLERGLYKEAYDDLKAAEGKRPVNPMLHLHLAQLHYHVRDEGVPFDMSAAERHVNLAIRYATSLRGDLGEDGSAVVDLVYRTAAHLALVKGGDLSKSSGPAAGEADLRRAEGFLLQIDQPSPSSQFLHAQVLALLGRSDESCEKVRVLADYIRSWIPRALSEPNLSSIADRVRAISENLKTSPGVYSQLPYQDLSAGREFAKQCSAVAGEFSSPSAELAIRLVEIEHDFESGAINAISAATALECDLVTAKAKTVLLIDDCVDKLEANRKKEEGEAGTHEWHAKRRRVASKEIAKFLSACAEALFAFRDDDEILYVILGVVSGLVLGMVSCGVVHGAGNKFLYFLLSGPAGALLLPFFRRIAKYESHTIGGPDADAHLEAAKQARRQAEILEQRADKVKRIKAALGLDQF